MTTCPACGERLPPAPGRCAECGAAVGDVAPCPPDAAAALARSRERLEVASVVVGTSGMVLLVFSALVPVLEGLGALAASAFVVGGLVLLAAGLGVAARLEGRSAAWGALGLLGCVGVVVVYSLRRACRRCGTRWRRRDERCPGCGAPP